ncbi:DMT family transporter [Albibacillus kandeliae]|uniref:DMT family transporter n=1 Tax=Albibacillus kandeliae TaxID=2174228 RepID=UPI000D69B0E1|nr:DMT family transporter [Albibacillus kandeliae]
MELWIPVTVAAATFQTLRFMLQKTLSATRLSAAGATFARFVYSAPVILAILAIWLKLTGTELPAVTPLFWTYAAVGGLTQILATVLVVLLFKQRNFAVGITFKKTEVMQTALVGAIVLGEGISLGGFLAILVGLAAVLVLSKTPDVAGPWWRALVTPASLTGLASGALFAVSGVTYRGASLQLDAEAPLRAGVTLAAVVTMQTLAMTIWLLWRDPGQIRAVWVARCTAVWVGLTSLAGSFCWFLAFTLQNAAYVNALGQVEMVLSLLASVLFFRETIHRREMLGMALLGVSLLTLILVI